MMFSKKLRHVKTNFSTKRMRRIRNALRTRRVSQEGVVDLLDFRYSTNLYRIEVQDDKVISVMELKR